MAKTITVRHLEFGVGNPKICVPLTSVTADDLLADAIKAKQAGADLVEWRADWYEDVLDPAKLNETAGRLRQTLDDMPILFTYRTEGGAHVIPAGEYIRMNKAIAASGMVDIIDVELFMGDRICEDMVSWAHQHGVKVIISSHDFAKTPSCAELIERMAKMTQLGADIPKVAVMPQHAQDVLELLSATCGYLDVYDSGPVITMSMSWLGSISRISGMFFGSALTFGTAGKASAPGQLAVDEVKQIFGILAKPE